MGIPRKFGFRVVTVVVLTLALLGSGLVPYGIAPDAYAQTTVLGTQKEQPILVVTGDSLTGADRADLNLEKSYTKEELDALADPATYRMTAINSSDTKKYIDAKGVLLASLLGGKSGTLVASAPDGYGSNRSFDTAAQRYFYPNLANYSDSGDLSENATPVPAVLAFSEGELSVTQATAPDAAITLVPAKGEDGRPTLRIGQTTPTEVNNSNHISGVQEVRLGGALPPVLQVTPASGGAKSYTRAQLLLMPRVPAAFTYSSSGSDRTDHVRGVDLADLVSGPGFTAGDTLALSTADNYNDPVYKDITVAQVRTASESGTPYVLAYEVGDAANALNAVVDSEKNNPSNKAWLRVYHASDKPAKLVTGITLTAAPQPEGGYKHTDYSGAPYNISALTGATLTVEGPGVQAGVAIPVGNLEGADAADTHTGVYTDTRGGTDTARSYQGIRVTSVLEGKVGGTGAVNLLTQNANLVFKNRWRQTVASIPAAELNAAQTPVLLAWGTAGADGKGAKPFVYNGADGKDSALGNEDGCLKLVYDKADFQAKQATFGDGGKFSSVAYIYVEEASPAPGFRHDKAPYDDPQNTEHIVTFGGNALGAEINFRVKDLEKLATDKPSLVHSDEYSLANTTYWYVNQYEGLDLWKLLREFGLPESYGDNEQTGVTFRAWDHYKTSEKFSTADLAHPDRFYYYEKAINDLGTTRPPVNELIPPGGSSFPDTDANGYPVKKGYPVLLAYGVNGYPYVRNSSMDGFKSGLANEGGPVRAIFGKRDYYHSNGSNQLQRIDGIFVGDAVAYSAHSQNPGAGGAYQTLSNQQLTIETVRAGGGTETQTLTVGEIEGLLYGSGVTDSQRANRQEKAWYFHKKSGGGAAIEDLFEGVNLWYLLSEAAQIPGTLGTVTFNDDPSTQVSLDRIREEGYNSVSGTNGLGAVLAFAENGFPLVADSASPGYVNTHPNVAGLTVKNTGGPLALILPQTAAQNAANDISGAPVKVEKVTKITVNLEPDHYAHETSPYDALADNEVQFTGAVKDSAVTLSVGAIERKQTFLVTDLYGEGAQAVRYRGIDLYKLLNDAQVRMGSQVEKVVVTGKGGDSLTIQAADLAGGVDGKRILLAYGQNKDTAAQPGDGKPLVQTDTSPGYEATYGNSGGPLKLVVQPSGAYAAKSVVEDVVSIEVVAAAVTGWKHDYGVYAAYKDRPALVISGSDVKETKTFTVGELEALDAYFVQDTYTLSESFLEVQGLGLWALIRDEVGLKDGVSKPSALKFNSVDNYPLDLSGQIDNIVGSGINGKPVLVAYGQNGYPLVAGGDGSKQPSEPGFVEAAGNAFGPLRLFVNNNSGWCEKWLCSIVVGTGDFVKPGETVETPDSPWFILPKPGAPDTPASGARNIVPSAAGGVYMASTVGLYEYSSSGALLKDYTDKLAVPFIYDVAEDGQGNLYVTQGYDYGNLSNNKGLARIAPDGGVVYFNTQNSGLPDDFVQAVEVAPNGDVYIGSFGGLTRFSPSTGEWKTWTRADGLPALSISVLSQDADGGMWFGCYPDEAGGTGSNSGYVGGYGYLSTAGAITFAKRYDADAYSGDLLADYWVRDIAPDGVGGAYVVRSGSYADLPNIGGRVDYVSAAREVVSRTGQSLLPDLKDKATAAINPEIRRVLVDAAGNLWYGTSGLGAYRTAGFGDKAPTHHSSAVNSWSSDSLDNVYAMSALPSGLVYAGAAFRLFEESKGGDSGDGGTSGSEVLLRIYDGDKLLLSFTKAAYNKLPKTEQTFSHRNTYNSYAKTTAAGVLLSDVFAAAGVQAGGIAANRAVTFSAGESFTADLTWSQAFEPRYYFDPDGARGDAVSPVLTLRENEGLVLSFGQKAASEQNYQAFVKGVNQITLGQDAGKWGNVAAAPSGGGIIPADKIRLLRPEGTGDAKVHYTVDGSEPTLESPIFNVKADRWLDTANGEEHPPVVAPVTEGAFTIKARIMGIGRAPGDTATFTYTVDNGLILPRAKADALEELGVQLTKAQTATGSAAYYNNEYQLFVSTWNSYVLSIASSQSKEQVEQLLSFAKTALAAIRTKGQSNSNVNPGGGSGGSGSGSGSGSGD
ncbi:MAG: chitobiase/beta-hexosaminidase C-terminal domain-containing protein, partial [Clostridiales Family XIII bacterium]|nr:chitobiase/beta-hexosaminidase C-terminal domain-containing protein [Clostridiales Family XIII bacterium]